MSQIAQLEALGFDKCTRTYPKGYRVRCSQCEALVINGTPCHETGCPNSPPKKGRGVWDYIGDDLEDDSWVNLPGAPI